MSQGIHLVTAFYQIFKTTLLSSDSCDIRHISLSFHKLPAPSAISTLFHSAINAILSIFLNICRFFSVLEDCSQQFWSQQPKAALWLLHLPKGLWLTVMSSSTSVSLRENQGCPSLFSLFLQPSTLKTLTFAFTPRSHMRGHLESSKPLPRSTQMLCAALLTQVSCACSELHEEGEEKGFRAFFLFPNRFFKSCNSVMNIHFNGVLKTQLDDTSERKWSRNKRN